MKQTCEVYMSSTHINSTLAYPYKQHKSTYITLGMATIRYVVNPYAQDSSHNDSRTKPAKNCVTILW